MWKSFCTSVDGGSRGWNGKCRKIVVLPLLSVGVVGVVGVLGAGIGAGVALVINEYLVIYFLNIGRRCEWV